MIVAALIVLAAYAFAGPQILEKLKAAAGKVPEIKRRHVAGAALVAAAAVMWANSRTAEPTPAPTPDPGAGLVLRGLFVGPDAAADAAAVSAHFSELAAELEWDGMQPEPLYRTGIAWDELRTRAKALRWKGASLGEKHPRARQAIHDFLDRTAGTAGGPMSAEQRAAWVTAYREIARPADVSR